MIKLKSSYVVGTMIERFIARSIMLVLIVATLALAVLGTRWVVIYHKDVVDVFVMLFSACILFGICLAQCAPSAFEQQNDPNAKDQD